MIDEFCHQHAKDLGHAISYAYITRRVELHESAYLIPRPQRQRQREGQGDERPPAASMSLSDGLREQFDKARARLGCANLSAVVRGLVVGVVRGQPSHGIG